MPCLFFLVPRVKITSLAWAFEEAMMNSEIYRQKLVLVQNMYLLFAFSITSNA